MKDLVSIIIPCYNDGDYIEQAVQSIHDQTYSNKEIIIIDDGSNTETKKVLKNLLPSIDILITQENLGPSASRNRGIDKASGEFILLLDSDDYFEPEFCEKALAIFRDNLDAKVVTCWARWFYGESHQIFKPIGGDLKNYLIQNAAIGTSMFKKDDWKKINGYDERMGGFEDWEFYIRLHKDGGKTHVIPEVLFNYRKRKSSRNTIANQYNYEILEYIYLKHGELYKKNYELLIPHLLGRLKIEKSTKLKREKSVEYKIGAAILQPIRYIKNRITKF